MGFRGEQIGKNGVVYIFDATSVWNAAKQRSEQRRIYIGKKDPETGKLIPNKKFLNSIMRMALQKRKKNFQLLSMFCLPMSMVISISCKKQQISRAFLLFERLFSKTVGGYPLMRNALLF